MTTRFEVKDSGKREEFASGMVRDTEEGKIKYHLIASGPMLKRWAMHLTSGAKKYSDNNWMKASGEEEYQRFRNSAFRHFMQWFQGDTDEDHAAAVYFNLNGAEYVRERMGNGSVVDPDGSGVLHPSKVENDRQEEGGVSLPGEYRVVWYAAILPYISRSRSLWGKGSIGPANRVM